jgi:uncharacterized phage protein (TIGR02218 family)
MRTPLWEQSAGALTALLNSGGPLNKADLYTLTLANNTTLRWSGHDGPLLVNSELFALGPGIERSRCSWTIGTEVDTLTLTLLMDAARPLLISGTPLLAYIANGGFIGASMQLARAFWGVGDAGPVGTLLWFRGRVSEVPELDRNQATLTVKSELERLNVKVPRQVYQAQCLATVYDTECGLNRASFTTGFSATGVSTLGRTQFPSTVAAADGFYDLGTCTWTSGPNAGTARTVKRQVGGSITLLSPLPAAVSPGDAFILVPGCDGRQATCTTKFANTARFKGQPFIPQPETVI